MKEGKGEENRSRRGLKKLNVKLRGDEIECEMKNKWRGKLEMIRRN